MNYEARLMNNIQTIKNRFHNDLEAFLVETMAIYEEAPIGTNEEQLNKLARFIMDEVPGEPSKSESVIDTAIRIIKHYQNQPYSFIGTCSWCGERFDVKNGFMKDRKKITDEAQSRLIAHAKNCIANPVVRERNELRTKLKLISSFVERL